jgi:hypothetical protein
LWLQRLWVQAPSVTLFIAPGLLCCYFDYNLSIVDKLSFHLLSFVQMYPLATDLIEKHT